mmetsp:Transcript_31709/g.48571  ORF Transcript_31709/g.48571 Transcript_31709/m.48571 type:complete len:174 (+) Transcript_31709:1313-1834(+)
MVYFINFNFGAGLLRLVYLVFLLTFPIASLITNLIIANNLSNVVLQDQHNLALNAEYLDFEDNDEDILRKAKVLAVKRRLNLQRYAMTPIFLTGFFKVLSEQDFPMQIYCGYIIELFTLSLPILILQVINNVLMQNWRFDIFFSLGTLALNLAFNIRGIISIGDRMQEEQNDL